MLTITAIYLLLRYINSPKAELSPTWSNSMYELEEQRLRYLLGLIHHAAPVVRANHERAIAESIKNPDSDECLKNLQNKTQILHQIYRDGLITQSEISRIRDSRKNSAAIINEKNSIRISEWIAYRPILRELSSFVYQMQTKIDNMKKSR